MGWTAPSPRQLPPEARAQKLPPASPPVTPGRSLNASRKWKRGYLRAVLGVLLCLALGSLWAFGSTLSPPPHKSAWVRSGCPSKIVDLVESMDASFQNQRESGIPHDLGNPISRKHRTAIVNMVSFHVEVVAALAYEFVKMRHNVTIFSRDDELNMKGVIYPFFWKGIRRFERFFGSFAEYDTVVLATYPTCHESLLTRLASFGLSQRYAVVVHNPDLLRSGSALQTLATTGTRVLGIAPHVLEATRGHTSPAGVRSEWIAPIFPVIMPEECERGTWKAGMPSCDRRKTWPGLARGVLPGQPLGRPTLRRGVCLQGKLDPLRRDYAGVFAEMIARREELLAANVTLILQGRGGGRGGTDIVTVPPLLVQAGLVKTYSSLPFQEYYEVLHGCMAVLPAFASPAYYAHKGSSSVGTALIAGTPVIATERLLQAYSYLTDDASYVVDEESSHVDAMLNVARRSADEQAKTLRALAQLRTNLLRRNLQTICRLMGPDYDCSPRGNLESAQWGVVESSAFLAKSKESKKRPHHARTKG